MITKVFTVYDSKVESYMRPFFDISKGAAIRGFQEVCNDKSTNLGKYPEDFTLFEIGEYDDSNAVIKSHLTPISLGVGSQFVLSV